MNKKLKSVCKYEKESTVLQLLHKADINEIIENGDIMLVYTCLYNMEKVALKLLEYKNVIYHNKQTALQFAIKNKMELITSKLLDYNDIKY